MDKKVLDTLQALCSRREYCASEMRSKAEKSLSGNIAEAEEIVAQLVSEGFVDDFRYARAFARDKAQLSGWGPAKISFMLHSRGISAEAINAALVEVDAGKAEERMISVLKTKYNSIKNDPQWRLKLIRFGLTRGYDYDSISKFLAEL